MKTKELPKEFTFICDEKSREQLEKLGVGLGIYLVDSINDYYHVKNNKVCASYFAPITTIPLINLSDYLPTTKYRFKTQEEFEATCEKNEDGKYICGDTYFINKMHYLFGQEIDIDFNGDSLERWNDNDGNSWIISPEMLVPIKVEQKWQDKTRGGYEYHIYEEIEGKIFGRLFIDKSWVVTSWDINGIDKEADFDFDLIPYNPRRTEIENRLAEIEAERERLNEELEQLNK